MQCAFCFEFNTTGGKTCTLCKRAFVAAPSTGRLDFVPEARSKNAEEFLPRPTTAAATTTVAANSDSESGGHHRRHEGWKFHIVCDSREKLDAPLPQATQTLRQMAEKTKRRFQWKKERRALPLGDFWGTATRKSDGREVVLFVVERKTVSNLFTDLMATRKDDPGRRLTTLKSQVERLSHLSSEAEKYDWNVGRGFIVEKDSKSNPFPYPEWVSKAAAGFCRNMPSHRLPKVLYSESTPNTFELLEKLMQRIIDTCRFPEKENEVVQFPTPDHLKAYYSASSCYWEDSSPLWLWLSAFPRMTDDIAKQVWFRLGSPKTVKSLRRKIRRNPMDKKPACVFNTTTGGVISKRALMEQLSMALEGERDDSGKHVLTTRQLAVMLNRVKGVSMKRARTLAREGGTLKGVEKDLRSSDAKGATKLLRLLFLGI